MTDDLVDIHCHGALGAEFGATVEGSTTAVGYHRARGVAGLVASLVSAPAESLERQVRVLAPLVSSGTLLGIHLEGPFISPARRGAHDPAALQQPDPDLVRRLVDAVAEAGAAHAIRHWTFAPELDGAHAFVETLVAHGIRPSVGHTDGDAATVSRFLSSIADLQGEPALVTHLFNGMPAFHHRAGGPVAACLSAASRGEAFVELIADGTHVAAEVVRMVFETVGPEHVVLVSDAMSATGLGDGRYTLGGLEVDVVAGEARLVSTGSIAGSTRSLADCVEWATAAAGVPAASVREAAGATPRRALGW